MAIVTATLPTEVALCARVCDGLLACLGLVHRPTPARTYCTKCGTVDGPTALYALAGQVAAARVDPAKGGA